MLSFIKCVECPKVCAPNTSNFFKLKIYHLGLSRKTLFYKSYIDSRLLEHKRENTFIFFLKIKTLSHNLIFNEEGTKTIKVEVGYEKN